MKIRINEAQMHLDINLISENRTRNPVVILAELHRNNINMHCRTIANDLITIKELNKTQKLISNT